MKKKLCGVVFFLVIASTAHARPEYAVKTNVSCANCHVNPWGGGPRTVYGKVYGSRNLGLGKFSNQDLFSANLRGIAYYPDSPSQETNGVALMEASGSANVPVIEESETSKELRAVFTYNMAPLSAGAREAYLRWKPNLPEPFPTYLMVGRFSPNFGLMTDEHRTYTRMQTNMTFNNYEMGIAVSGSAASSVFYDLALVNDFQTGGLFNTTNFSYAGILNIRWMPSFLPFFIGASQNYQRLLNVADPFGTSLYLAFSLDRFTESKLNGSILFETVWAKNFDNPNQNPYITNFFVPTSDSAYLDSLPQSRSEGYYFQFKYDLNPRWTLVYKLDWLALSSDFTGDSYIRHGAGFESFLNSNLILQARYERGMVGRPEILASHILAAQDDLFVMLRLWL